MEQYKDEKTFCKDQEINPFEQIPSYGDNVNTSIIDVLSKYKAYLIEQVKKGKMTLQECKDKVAKEIEFDSWYQLTDFSTNATVYKCIEKAAEMYANQLIPVAPAEQWISVKDFCEIKDIDPDRIVYEFEDGHQMSAYELLSVFEKTNNRHIGVMEKALLEIQEYQLDYVELARSTKIYQIAEKALKSTTLTK